MKAILEFDLFEQDDVIAHKRCIKATDMSIAIWDLQQEIRMGIKHSETPELFEKFREMLNKHLDAHNINIDEIIN